MLGRTRQNTKQRYRWFIAYKIPKLFIISMFILYSPLVLNSSEKFQCKLSNADHSSGLIWLSCMQQNDSERKQKAINRKVTDLDLLQILDCSLDLDCSKCLINLFMDVKIKSNANIHKLRWKKHIVKSEFKNYPGNSHLWRKKEWHHLWKSTWKHIVWAVLIYKVQLNIT